MRSPSGHRFGPRQGYAAPSRRARSQWGRCHREQFRPRYRLSYFRRFEAGGGLDVEARRELAPSGSAQVLDTTGLTSTFRIPAHRSVAIWGRRRGFPQPQTRWQAGPDKTALTPPSSLASTTRSTKPCACPPRTGSAGRTGSELPDDATSNAVFLTLNWTRPWDLYAAPGHVRLLSGCHCVRRLAAFFGDPGRRIM